MRKIISIFLFLFVLNIPLGYGFSLKKKEKPVLFLTATNPELITYFDTKNEQVNVFRTNDKIYFTIYMPYGFKSEYIKYQIVKQDDNAHTGGYTRMRNITRRVDVSKKSYCDYFTISQAGKYYIQIFDIQNLHQWLAIGAFRVVER